MDCTQQITTGQLLISGEICMGIIVICLLISNWSIGLFEKNFIWAQSLLGPFDVCNIPNDSSLSDPPFDTINLMLCIGKSRTSTSYSIINICLPLRWYYRDSAFITTR